jgi:acetylornithine deacetylase/succinyl-diaminopimelate desuccinylase-like protein
MLDHALSHARDHNPTYLEQLIELLRIPSVSTLLAHREDVRRASRWLVDDMSRLGLKNTQTIETDGNPVVYGEWLEAGPDAPTVLLYGHYDVQPVDPIELWDTPPFEPTLKDGLVYARGASDNKAQFFSHLKGMESTLAAEGRLPVNVKVCLDGEEEVGSPNLEPFVVAHRELLAADLVIVSDGAMAGPGKPILEYALRGIITAEVTVKGPRRDLHSGRYGGSVHNPLQALAEIITALHDDNGTVTIPGFYDNVVALTEEERQLLDRVPYKLPQWQENTGAPRPWGEREYALLERTTARPTCEVNGIWGGFQEEGFKTVIPATAGAKISMRLVAKQDPGRIGRLFTEYLEVLTPDTVKIEIEITSASAAAVTKYDSPAITAASLALQTVWQEAPTIGRAGGSLPIIATFQKELGTPFILMPYGLDDNRHSPNEHYDLDRFKRGIETSIRFYHNLSDVYQE